MASFPYMYTDYHFSPDEFSDITSVMAQENYGGNGNGIGIISPSTFPMGTTTCCGGGGATFGNENLPVMFNNVGFDVFPTESEVMSPVPATSLPGQIGISDMNVPTFLEYERGLSGNITKVENFGGGLADACFEYGEESCCGFVPYLKPVYPAAPENLGIQCNGIPNIGHPNFKVGQYTVEERRDRILRYLKKRNRRNFNKTIKYTCRKTLADRRIRVRGRFARNNELREEDNEVKKNDNSQQENEIHCSDAVLVKNDDDDGWMEEAIASLMYTPYISS